MFQNFALVTFARRILTSAIPIIESYVLNNSGGSDVTTISVNKPTGVATGNLLLGIAGTRQTGTTFNPAPSGFSESADGQGIEVVTRTADGSEGSSFTFTQSTSSRMNAGVLRISNWTTVTQGTPGGSNTAAGITMPKAGLLIAAFAIDSGGGGPVSLSTPSGMTLLGTIQTSGNTWLAIYTQQVAAGATGDRTTTVGGSGTARGVLIGVTN